MPVPTNSAAIDLGLGDRLAQQAAGETDDERKRRMEQIKLTQSLGSAGSLAVNSIFGPMGGSASAGN